MPAEITMPQLSDTMTEGTLVKWHKTEGDKIKSGDTLADVETDKATMPAEAFDSGTLAYVAAKEGEKIAVGGLIAVIAVGSEDPKKIKDQYSSGKKTEAVKAETPAKAQPSAKPPFGSEPQGRRQAAAPTAPAPVKAPSSAPSTKRYDFDLVVIGGGPAGYAAAIRAGQLKKRVLCIEKENLGGTCLNWGCIPTKALLEDANFVRKLKEESADRGVTVKNIEVDFSKIVGRSRAVADKLAKGIGHLFKKYEVKHEIGTGKLLAAHKVQYKSADGQAKDVSADHVIIATGARPMQIPGIDFDGQKIISSREAMILKKLPKKMAIIGAGAIGCEFADVYSALGTEVTIVEMLPSLLPNEDKDVSVLLERIFTKRGVHVFTSTKTDKIEKTKDGVKLTLSGAKAQTIDADLALIAIGVQGNADAVAAPESKLEIVKNRVKVDRTYRSNLENVWAIGDVIAVDGNRHPDLAHVAHHEAVYCVERIFGFSDHTIDYANIPACTYTHPQVASMGMTEAKARESGKDIKIGKFPMSVSGRALAAGETDGFVKLIFDAKYGELLGVHMIGENVTELLSELVLARKLEATESEIIEAMHPHPTISEAVMEAAGVAVGRAIHL